MYYTYILFSQSLDQFYIGHTSMSLDERLRRHLSDHKGYTGKAKDWRVAYFEEYSTKSDANKRELAIKRKRNRKYIEFLISNGS